MLDDTEKALENAVSVYKTSLKYNEYVYGAGAIETKLINYIENEAGNYPGME